MCIRDSNGTAACTLVPGTSPAPCQMSIAWGTTLQLVNTPAVGSVLASLGGACVLGTPCTIRVTGDVQVAPRFEPGLRVELLPGGTGGGSLSALGPVSYTHLDVYKRQAFAGVRARDPEY